jgi:hypothetical protein
MTNSASDASIEKKSCCCACSTDQQNEQPDLNQNAGPAGWMQGLLAVPAAALPLLPSFTCPMCIAAYAGVLSAAGFGFVLQETILNPLIVAFLVLQVVVVGWTTRSHRNPTPLVATLIGAVSVVAGRLVWDMPAALYLGIALLVGASIWNLWLKRPRQHNVATTKF